MAAAMEDNSSNSEAEEELQRLREAAWNPHGNFKTSSFPSAEPHISREKAKNWGQNGRELQTTPEFQAHVAKKLGAILDSSITILEHTSGPAQNSQRASEVEEDGDMGFRLFSSSIPGDCGKLESAPLERKRLQCSSSSEQDSDQEWQRCREAAVSAADILQLSGFPTALQNSSTDHRCQVSEPSRKKKKKKAMAKVCSEDSGEEDVVETVQNAQIGEGTEGPLCLGGPCKKEGRVIGEVQNGLSGKVMMKKKKKKKKKTEVRTVCEPLVPRAGEGC